MIRTAFTIAAIVVTATTTGCAATATTRQMTEAQWDRCVSEVEERIIAEGGSCGGSNCWTKDGVNSGVVVMERCGGMPNSAAKAVNEALMTRRYGTPD